MTMIMTMLPGSQESQCVSSPWSPLLHPSETEYHCPEAPDNNVKMVTEAIEYSRAALPCTLPPVWLELPDLLFNRETLI